VSVNGNSIVLKVEIKPETSNI